MQWVFSLSFLLCFCLGCSHTKEHSPHAQALKIAIPNDPATLDPRLARDLISVNITSMLFSGLTQTSRSGSVELALADTIEKAPDNLHYKVTLKSALWSDNKPITASDVEYSWKSVLQKKRGCPNASQLFWLKGAKEAYMGSAPLENVGVTAVDPKTIAITLEQECPFFEKLLSTTAYLPIQQDYDLHHSSGWEKETIPCSGPYILTRWDFNSSLVMSKNAVYCASTATPCEQLIFAVVDNQTAVTMFEAGELDLVGSPLGYIPSDALKFFSDGKLLKSAPSASTVFLRVNTQKGVLKDSRIRQAIFYSIDRKSIVDGIFHKKQQPALTLSPAQETYLKTNKPLCNIPYAKKLLADYCEEHECTPSSIHISIACFSIETSLKVAESLQSDLKKNLGIDITLSPKESKLLFSDISSLSYDLTLSSWFADYDDPYSFYAVFESASNGTNNTGWQDTQYANILALSLATKDQANREKYFADLEQILLDQMPIIPIYHVQFSYLASAQASKLGVLPTGQLYAFSN